MEEIPENPTVARSMLRDMMLYLRYSLNSVNEPIVTVQKEMDAVKIYLKIQETRFETRLNSEISVSAEASIRPIVSFLLQPLIENAIKHGSLNERLDLNINITTYDSSIRIQVKNRGHLSHSYSDYKGRTPIGLMNLRQRLDLHYPGRYQFSLNQLEEDLVLASLNLDGAPCSES